MFLAIAFLTVASDTLRISAATRAPSFDGRADSAEWGAPTVTIQKPGGRVLLWLRRWRDTVYLAASIPDSTFYWGDDLVISLDTRGDRASLPQHDDFQWYFRRVLDSSVVYRGNGTGWLAPRGDPDWRLGPAKEGGGWEVRSVDQGKFWTLELKLDPEWFAEEDREARSPGISFRTYDDEGNRWYVWPANPGVKHPTEVEMSPRMWGVVVTGLKS